MNRSIHPKTQPDGLCNAIFHFERRSGIKPLFGGRCGGPRLAPSGERCESQSPVSNGQSRAGAPTGVRGEVNGPLRTEANCLDCGHLSRFAARRLCFFVRLRGRGCSIVNTPCTPIRFSVQSYLRVECPSLDMPPSPLAAVHGGADMEMNTHIRIRNHCAHIETQ